MLRVIFFITFLLLHLDGSAQSNLIDFVLADQSSHRPIEDVHVFVGNTSFGTISDEMGKVSLEIPNTVTDELVVTHIAYETQLINHELYHKLSSYDTVFLSSNGIDLSEITVVDKRTRQWKRNFKKFSNAFLGDDKASKKCIILNPEVLRFELKGGVLEVKAIDLINIRNNFLGYEINFLLNSFSIKTDGSVQYHGYANFKDKSGEAPSSEITFQREVAYQKSPRHFFVSLLSNKLDRDKYRMETVKYHTGEFVGISASMSHDNLEWDSSHHVYKLLFDDYLQITNYNIKEIVVTDVGVRSNGLESQRFGNTQSGPNTTIEFATSQLFKISPALYIDPSGHVLNREDVREYGTWASQRMSMMLPLDYGVKYDENDAVSSIPKVNNDKISDLSLFMALIYKRGSDQKEALNHIKANWNNGFFAPLLDIVLLSTDKEMVKSILELLRFKSHQGIVSYYGGLKWLWQQAFEPSVDYSDFKAELYQYIDPHFKTYFLGRQDNSTIGLDEIVWGGVKQDGIPPLRYPKLIRADDATDMKDDQIVFGISLNGHTRAYPKRILAWHEFVVDSIKGVDIAGVYCTLCGTMIAYDMKVKGTKHNLGTSGFLFRSNKLMYDNATQSLWSTIDGRPILGPLVDKNISLKTYPISTTTWGEWKRRHPSTLVLSDDTGFDRNYKEGEAYKSYYFNDNLMFPVPLSSNRLKNKEEVFVIRSEGYRKDPLAITVKYLKRHRLYMDEIAGQKVVVLTDKKGSSRVYELKNVSFKKYKNGKLIDSESQYWNITEDALTSPEGAVLNRLPSHRIFWFSWYNNFPNTRLRD